MKTNDVITYLTSSECTDMFNSYWINKVYLFGSYSRWEQNKKSDIDLLIDTNRWIHKLTLFDLIEIEDFLKNKLWVPSVDIWTRKSLNKHILSYVEKDLIKIK
mgnify:CR=1 FL=1